MSKEGYYYRGLWDDDGYYYYIEKVSARTALDQGKIIPYFETPELALKYCLESNKLNAEYNLDEYKNQLVKSIKTGGFS